MGLTERLSLSFQRRATARALQLNQGLEQLGDITGEKEQSDLLRGVFDGMAATVITVLMFRQFRRLDESRGADSKDND